MRKFYPSAESHYGETNRLTVEKIGAQKVNGIKEIKIRAEIKKEGLLNKRFVNIC